MTSEAKKSGETKQSKVEEKLRKENQELLDMLKRTQAEFENFRKRVERDRTEHIKRANKELLLKILPIVDNFELALKSCKVDNEVFKGFELIYSQMMSALENEGVKQIKEKEFNPELHEPLLQEKADEAGKILEVLQKGYFLNEKVLRTAKVKISTK